MNKKNLLTGMLALLASTAFAMPKNNAPIATSFSSSTRVATPLPNLDLATTTLNEKSIYSKTSTFIETVVTPFSKSILSDFNFRANDFEANGLNKKINNTDKVVTYNKDLSAHKDVEKSTFYKVEIKQNGTTYETFVNMAKSNDVIKLDVGREKVLKDRTISWASFDFSGTVTVSVTVLNTQSIPLLNTIKLLPSQAGIKTTKVGTNKVEFTLTNPDQLSLEIGDEGYKNGLLLFANAIETDIMNQNSSDVFVCNPCNGIPNIPSNKTKVYFTDRVHDLGEWYIPSHIKEVYFKGNAAVMGKINLKDIAGPIKLYGRGSLVNDKDEYQRKEQGLIKTIGSTNNVTVKDIVLVRREKLFGISLHGTGNLISNIKLIGGFNVNNDGIFVGKGNSLCENTFLMVNDDGLKTFTEDAVYKNTTMWILTNGAAIQTGWSSKKANNVKVDGLYIVRAEWEKAGVNLNNGAILNSRLRDIVNGDNNLQTNIVVKNIYTEHPIHQFIRLDNDPIATHKIDGLELSNWNVSFLEGGQNKIAYTKGYIKNIKLNNFKVNGSCLSNLDDAKNNYNFITNTATTGLTFNCDSNTTGSTQTIKAYPVPTTGILNLPEVVANDQIKVASVQTGLTVLSKTITQTGSTQLDITNQPAGNYIIQILRNGQVLTRQIIKE